MTVAAAVCTFVANALWQSTLLVSVTWAILRILRGANATTRYAVWLATLAAGLSLPIVTTAVTMPHATASTSARANAAQPAEKPHGTANAAGAVANAGLAQRHAVRQLQHARFTIPPVAGIAVAAGWATIAALLLARLAISLLHLERLKRDALPFAPELRARLVRWNRANKGSRDVRLCISDGVAVPTAVGLFDAMILLPEDLTAHLDAADLDRVLLHELAHLRRRDDWSNALAHVVFALLFFSPAVAFAMARLDVEREVACDDTVLAQDAEALVYANTLARMTELVAWPHRPLAAPGIFMTRRGMSVRIERILEDGRDVRARMTNAPAALVLAAIAAISLTGEFAPSIALSQTENAVTDTLEPAPADIAYTGTWDLKPFENKRVKSTALLFNLHYHAGFSNWNVPAEDLEAAGVDPQHLIASSEPIVFSLVRQAGTFECNGTAGDGVAHGEFRFHPDPAYAAAFASLGLKLSLRDQVIAGMANVPLDYVRGIAAMGMLPMSFQSLMGLKMMGGSLEQVRAIRRDFPDADAQAIASFVWMQERVPDTHALHEDFPSASIDDVTTMGMAGVTPAYVDALRKAGVRGLSANNVTALRSAGVDEAFVGRMIAAGKAGLTVDEVVALKRSGF